MNTKKVYIVKGEKGSYDDYVEFNICVVVSEDRAKQITDKLNELEKFISEFEVKQREFLTNWINTNPTPEAPSRPKPSEEYYYISQKCADKKATEQDKKKYRELQMLHDKELDKYNLEGEKHSEIVRLHRNKQEAARAEWFMQNYNPPEHLNEVVYMIGYNGSGYYYNDKLYSYEEATLYE